MQSEFYNVALDRLRYSLVWEDHLTLYTALDIQPDDRLLLITSAGCNVLNALLKNPAQVVAIDLNPVQNKLLGLKAHAIQHHTHAVLRGLMGFDGPQQVAEAREAIRATLPADEYRYWLAFFNSHPDGILTAGKLESYITGFFATLDENIQQKVRQLIAFDNTPAQWRFFRNELQTTSFSTQFIQYFDDANLSKGRDPALFTYAQESGGVAFYNRLCRQLSTTLVSDNFFFRFFFFGPQQLPEHCLPPCYQAQHFATLRAGLNRLTIVDGEAVDYLAAVDGQAITKASLSNIFEYTSQHEFWRVCDLLTAGGARQLRFVFWNLLQEQGADAERVGLTNLIITDQPVQDTACFYFRNVRVVNAKAASVCPSDPS